LANEIGVGCNAWSIRGLRFVPGQTNWYGTPSKSVSVPVQPIFGTNPAVLLVVSTQPTSSSPTRLLFVFRSCTPSTTQSALEMSPKASTLKFPLVVSTLLQYS